ncbi:hypothetical protein [Streptomyces heilongjiangensis]|uniref:Secreted protein n=1 Tax=Streptomyces heilongjiangensis TaxID=945052 RepID=A0ABW1AZS3_9ACTN|nr:hypothetical protein [Streptomyces heilongjiangensis]MDC2947913.1 hypothetical protein [Streptomyces heilongjiangensis]
MKRRFATLAAGVLSTTAVAWGVTVAPAAAAQGGEGAFRTQEAGHVLSCSGQADDTWVSVELYENSAYGSFVNVSVEGPGGQYGGHARPERLFNDGSVSVSLPLRLLEEGHEDEVGTASFEGTYAASGQPERVHDVYPEPGWRVISSGTRQELSAQVDAQVLGLSVPLTCDHAFAFDLTTIRTP